MKVSIILCTYSIERYDDFVDAINSLLNQSYNNFEIIIVVDGSSESYEKIVEEIEPDHRNHITKVILNNTNMGLSASRNNGIAVADGDVIAFFDDDAVADKEWLKELLRMYEEYDAIAAGGKILPYWIGSKPDFLPEEFYWLIGATHKGFGEGIREVRNTFGSNVSFKADVLRESCGFRNVMGVKGKGLLQGEETELCERMRNKFGKGVIYNPDAIVHHKVPPERLRMRFLLRRAFWQGYSKGVMEEMGYRLEEEGAFLKNLVSGIFERIIALSLASFKQLVFLIVLTTAVGLGYLYKMIGRRD